MSRTVQSAIKLLAATLVVIGLTIAIPAGCPQVSPDDGTNGGVDGPGVVKGNSGLTGKYVGSAACVTCHSRKHQNWSRTRHAGALETLEAIGQATSEFCLRCHTVGFGKPGGFANRATTDDLAGVGCESCHGPARDHVFNVADVSLRPKVDVSASVCGECHQGDHQPNFNEWSLSKHARVTETPAAFFEAGTQLDNCGKCHSGDYFHEVVLEGEEVPSDFLAGVAPSEMNAVTCAICHDPHARTGNAVDPDDGRDFQLRYTEVASPIPTNTVEAVTDAARFNLCGQCHHSRGRTWQETNRPPHDSVQANVYAGEMPAPEGDDPLVLSRTAVHSFARKQCATCHLYRRAFQSEESPTISGHTFEVNNNACSTSGCHPSLDAALAAQATLQTEIQARLDDIATRLGDPATWEYSTAGGPDSEGQAALSDPTKQIRFLYHYAISDGSLGIHNPDYVRSMLEEADKILISIGK